jgi:hypothetical protein
MAMNGITAALWGPEAHDALARSVASSLGVVDAPSSLVLAVTSVQDIPPNGVIVNFTVQVASAAAAASVAAWTAANAKLAPYVYTAASGGGGALAAIRPARSDAEHSFEAALLRMFSNGTAALADNGQRGDTEPLSLATTGAARILDYSFVLEGSPSASEADINGLVLTNLASAIAGGVTIRLHGATYAIYPSSVPLQPGFSDHHYRHLFNLGGFAAVLHGNRVWVGNSNGASINCAEGYDLSGNGTGPVWGGGAARDLEFVLDAAGKVASFAIGGVPAVIAAPTPSQFSVQPGCAPLLLQPGTPLFFGASGNEKFNDSASPVYLRVCCKAGMACAALMTRCMPSFVRGPRDTQISAAPSPA